MYRDPVRVPEAAKQGKARIRLSFPGTGLPVADRELDVLVRMAPQSLARPIHEAK